VGAPSDTSTAAAPEAAPHAVPPAGAAASEVPTARGRGRWWVWAAAVLILAAAFAIRIAYVDATPGFKIAHDALDYDGAAVSIAQVGHYPDTLAYGRPTAFRPPVYPYMLAGVYKLAGVERAAAPDRVIVARRMQVVIGTVLVAMIGLLAAQLWGSVVALVAMGLAAVYVPLVTMSGTLMSEPLFCVFMLGALSAAIAHRRSRHRYRWALLAGLLTGLAILTRANGLILLLPLVLAVWDLRPRWSLRALAPPVALVVLAVLVVSPWTIRNARTLHAFVPVSTQLGSALAGTYNDEARTDPEHPGSWRSLRRVPSYADLFGRVRETNEAVLERQIRRRALRYAFDHPGYVAQVAFWTTVRGFDLDGLDWSRHTASTVSIDEKWADRGVYCFWLFAVLALFGAFTRAARRAPWFVFLVIETPRYRTPIDPFIVVLAALALVAAGRRVARR
jgi:4-amino-4-deoxy-L-arabinose transferase-like glycosyltransferase